MCQNYPGAVRRKRDIDPINLRVNRAITPPPEVTDNLNDTLKELGVKDEVQEVVDQVYKVSAKALKNARAKYCNVSKTGLRISEEKVNRNKTNPDILGIVEAIAEYAKNMVDSAVANLTEFCAASEDIEKYQRARCPFFNGKSCPQTYRSTKSGPVRYSTQHRPVYIMSTKNEGNPYRNVPYMPLREGAASNTTEVTGKRRKRDVGSTTETFVEHTTVSEGRRRDDVTRVIIQRSKHDETTVVNEKNDSSRQKRLVEATIENLYSKSGRKDFTKVIHQRSEKDSTTDKNVRHDQHDEELPKDDGKPGTSPKKSAGASEGEQSPHETHRRNYK